MSSLLGPAVVDDRDEAIEYSSHKWLEGKSDRQFGGTCKFAKDAGESATFSFSGMCHLQSFDWFTLMLYLQEHL
jgi:hypothetical protein